VLVVEDVSLVDSELELVELDELDELEAEVDPVDVPEVVEECVEEVEGCVVVPVLEDGPPVDGEVE